MDYVDLEDVCLRVSACMVVTTVTSFYFVNLGHLKSHNNIYVISIFLYRTHSARFHLIKWHNGAMCCILLSSTKLPLPWINIVFSQTHLSENKAFKNRTSCV